MSAQLTEIKPLDKFSPDFGYAKATTPCPSCCGHMVHGPVACPDGKVGCGVYHIGLTCRDCGKQWRQQHE